MYVRVLCFCLPLNASQGKPLDIDPRNVTVMPGILSDVLRFEADGLMSAVLSAVPTV